MMSKPLSKSKPALAAANHFGSLDDVLAPIDRFDPRQYDKTRNYLDGAVPKQAEGKKTTEASRSFGSK